jgi:hypothetical protein
MAFEKIAPYLHDPLVLCGFALALFFGFGRTLLKSGLIPQQTQIGGYRILQRVLLYGFILSIVIILLGFGLKYRELSKEEQRAAASLIVNELKADRGVAGSLAANSATSLETTSELALALRSPASPLLKTFFPYRNIEPDDNTSAPSKMAHERLAEAIASGLPASQAQLDRMNAMARAIRGTLSRTRGALVSLSDGNGTRYRINRSAWNANASEIRRVSVVDLTKLERTYAALERARSDYDVLMRYNLAYADALDQFLAFKDNDLSEEGLSRVLAAERQYFAVARAYGRSIVDAIDSSGKATDELSRKVSLI